MAAPKTTFMKMFVRYCCLLVLACLSFLGTGRAENSAPQDFSSLMAVHVDRFDFLGNSIFSDQELAQVAHNYLGKTISAGDLEEIRRLITAYYIDHGYVHSGAIIPDQRLQDGVIRIKIEEGSLKGIEITGVSHLQPRYVESRLKRTAKLSEPLNYLDTLQRLRLLKTDPRIENIHAKIEPGLQPGEAILKVEVKEARPYQLSVIADNHRSPSVGSYQGVARATHNNITGWGDSIFLQYGITEGLNEYVGRYSIPLTRWDTSLSLYAERYSSDIIAEPFDLLDITSDTDRFGGSLRQPIFRNLSRELSLELELQHSKNQVKLSGVPFSFAPYEEGDQGIYRVSPLRFHQEYVDRGMIHVFAFRSSFSFGLDLWDATIDVDERLFGSDPPTADHFAWLGQAQFILRLKKAWDSQLLARGRLQFTPDPLLPSEQFGLGGYSTVRGYREYVMTTDNGANASLEWHIPVWSHALKGWLDKPQEFGVHVVPFFDWGHGWNTGDRIDPDPDSIYSTGLGLKIHWGDLVMASLYWGHALEDLPDPAQYDLQDDGIHLSVQVNIF